MFHTVRIPSVRTLLGELHDTLSDAAAALAAYQERLEQDPENETLLGQYDHLRRLKAELESKAGNLSRMFEKELAEHENLQPTYRGTRNAGGVTVTVEREQEDGGVEEKPLLQRQDLLSHTPDGFAWGYPGSGPAQLALALLADITGDGEYAVRRHQRFKRDVTAGILHDRWTIHGEDLAGWVQDHP